MTEDELKLLIQFVEIISKNNKSNCDETNFCSSCYNTQP